MKRYCQIFLLLVCLGCKKEMATIEWISFDYPHGETRLTVSSNGESHLFYGARPNGQSIKKGVFSTKEVYEQLSSKWHENVPREKWPNPNAIYGMVQIKFKDGQLKDFLIFDEKKYSEATFSKARANTLKE